LKHLIAALEEFRTRNVDFVSLAEQIDTSTPAESSFLWSMPDSRSPSGTSSARMWNSGLPARDSKAKNSADRGRSSMKKRSARRSPPAEVSRQQRNAGACRVVSCAGSAPSAPGRFVSETSTKLTGNERSTLLKRLQDFKLETRRVLATCA